MIKEIVMLGIKGQRQSQALTGKDIIIGPNGSGKTTRLQALGISLLGYVPGNGKLPAETFKLANRDEMTTGLVTTGFTFTRSFVRTEKTGKDGASNATVSQEITVSPSKGEKKTADKEARIAAEVGNFPVMLDFNEFLSLSDAKRRDFIYGLSAIESGTWDRPAVEKYLRNKLLTMDLEVNNPDQHRIMGQLIGEAMDQYPTGFDIQAGLQSMLDWAKVKQSHWNSEKKNAEGAVKKLADMKNQLAETDRNIAQHKTELEEIQKQLTDVEAQLARDQERKRIIDQRLARIAELQGLIQKLQGQEVSTETSGFDRQIKERLAQIKEHDFAADLASLEQELQMVNARIKELAGQERADGSKLAELQAEKGMLSRALARIEGMDTKEAEGKRPVSICVIHPAIGCNKDFSGAVTHFRQQLVLLEQKEADQVAVIQALQQEREGLETQKGDIERKRSQVFQDQSRQNSANEAARKAIAQLEKQKADVANAQARKDDQIKMYQEELQRLQNHPAEPIAPLDILGKRRDGLREQLKTLKAKLDEQERAKITLGNLKSSMIDSKTAAYYAQSAKDLAEALGAKGLQGELVKEVLDPIREDIQTNLRLMGIENAFFFRTESDTGREVFQFGWRDHFGDERNFDALSTGQQILLLIAMLVTFLDRANPPLRVLAIDNVENLDRKNLRSVLAGFKALNDKLDNVILSGVIDVYDYVPGTDGKYERVLMPEVKDWGITDLGQKTAEEVRQSA